MPDFVYTWVPSARNGAGAYRDPSTGQFLSNAFAREQLDSYIDNAQDTPTALYNLIRTNQISVADWQLQMRDHIKDVNLNAAISATGGRDQMTQADWGRAGQIIRGQYDFLDNFAEQIANGMPIDGRTLQRMKMYTDAGVSTHEAFTKNRMGNAGYDESRSILDSSPKVRHCTGEGSCIEQAAKGWQKIDDMIPLGNRICLTRDRCTVEYRNSITGEIAQ